MKISREVESSQRVVGVEIVLENMLWIYDEQSWAIDIVITDLCRSVAGLRRAE